MSYTVLARKYRPQTFDDLVGQDWISRTLKNAIKSGRIAHAFLFSGPRGVGKTSMARILSKALNCVSGPTEEPCLKCENCESISRGGGIDVVEIDAASNRGIDHIRTIRENVRYVPVSSRFKIYIIDEVHMLTTESFNALLKTLEEPPEHVKFIFATTEAQKMPETVRSRCQCYEFRRIGTPEIAERLEKIAELESIECEEGVMQRIAVLSRGGLRDAESHLDQIISLGDGKVTFEALNALTGRLAPSEVGDLVDAILEAKAADILEFIDRVLSSGTQGDDLLRDLTDYWRALMWIASGVPEKAARILSVSEERCVAQAKKTDLDRILTCLQITLDTLKKARWFDDERILTEIALLKMARLSHTKDLSDALRSLGRHQGGSAAQGGGVQRAVRANPPSARPQTGPQGSAPASRGMPSNSGVQSNPGSRINPGNQGNPGIQGNPGNQANPGNQVNPGPGSPSMGPSSPMGVTSNPAASMGGDSGPAQATAPMPVQGDLPPGEMYGKVLQVLAVNARSLAYSLRRLQVESFQEGNFVLLRPAGEANGLFDPENKEVKKQLVQASEKALGQACTFTVKNVEATGPGEVPPIVRKTIDRFDGNLM